MLHVETNRLNGRLMIVALLNRIVVGPIRAFAAFARGEGAMLVALVVIAGAVALFVDLADDLGEASHNAFDLQVIEMLHSGADPANPIGPDWLDRIMLDLTSLGSLAVLATMALIVTGYLVIQRQGLKVVALIVALGGGLVLSETLKALFERTRPPDIYRTVETLNASFPSGHALLSTVVYLTLGAMLARAAKGRRLKSYIMGVAIVIALIVGCSRVYLGLHWPSDVVAGWSMGAAWASVCWLAERSVRSRFVGQQPAQSGEVGQIGFPKDGLAPKNEESPSPPEQ